jgi:hypothetical protein
MRAEKAKVSQLYIIEGICDGRLPDITPTAKRKFLPFVKVIRAVRDLAEKVAVLAITLVAPITPSSGNLSSRSYPSTSGTLGI